METYQIHSRPQLSAAASWLATVVVACLCGVLGLASPLFIGPFTELFRGLGVDLPLPTQFLIAINVWLLPLLFAALAVFVILKEFVVRELRRRILLTGSVFLAAIVTAAIVVFILYLPELTLAAKLVKTK
jgi:type II secretory pathway component PulF